MSDRADVVIAGAGLAGACAALSLSQTRRVTVLDPSPPGSEATGAAAGLVNPFMGHKAKPAWRHDHALAALAEALDQSDPALWRGTGVIRPARDARQAQAFRDQAAAHAGLDWLSPDESAERWPTVIAHDGSLFVSRGGSVDLSAFVRAALAEVERRGGLVRREQLLRWETDGDTAIAITDKNEHQARHLILALGDGLRPFDALASLPLHRVKGQTVHLGRPPGLPADHPAVAGPRYIVPGADHVIVGATFEHRFTSTEPDPGLDAGLISRAADLVPALAEAEVLGRRAGVRMTVPTQVSPQRLPLVGPVSPGVWVFSGLGAKGALMAPLVASWLPDALDGRRPLPDEIPTARA